MKKKTKNIIAISVASVAALLIAFVLIINFIIIDPMKEMRSSSNYEIHYGATYLTGAVNQNDTIDSRNEDLGNRQYESTSMTELMNKCSFSVFNSWSQFKYDFAPGFGYDEYYEHDHNYITSDVMKGIYEGTDAVVSDSFYFIFYFAETQSITIRDSHGYEYTQYYDRAIYVLDDSKGWVDNIKMYVFEYKELYSPGHEAEKPDGKLGTTYFYPIVLGAVTTTSIEILEDIFDGHYSTAGTTDGENKDNE